MFTLLQPFVFRVVSVTKEPQMLKMHSIFFLFIGIRFLQCNLFKGLQSSESDSWKRFRSRSDALIFLNKHFKIFDDFLSRKRWNLLKNYGMAAITWSMIKHGVFAMEHSEQWKALHDHAVNHGKAAIFYPQQGWDHWLPLKTVILSNLSKSISCNSQNQFFCQSCSIFSSNVHGKSWK